MSTFHTGPVNPWPALPKASDEQLAALREAMRKGPLMPILPMPESEPECIARVNSWMQSLPDGHPDKWPVHADHLTRSVASSERMGGRAQHFCNVNGHDVIVGQSPMPIRRPPQTTFYGFFHNPDTYESAGALVSLHRTKASAYRAMNRRQWLEWEQLQLGQRLPYRKFGLRRERGAKVYIDEASYIRAVEVQP